MLVGVLMACTLGCNKQAQDEEYKGIEIDVKQTYEDMKNAVELPEMFEESSETDEDGSSFESLFDGYDYSGVKEYYYCSAQEGTPEEIAIIKVKDDKEADKLKKIVKSHMEARAAAYATYDPQYVDVVNEGVVAAKENYVMYAVGDFAFRSKAAFDNAFVE